MKALVIVLAMRWAQSRQCPTALPKAFGLAVAESHAVISDIRAHYFANEQDSSRRSDQYMILVYVDFGRRDELELRDQIVSSVVYLQICRIRRGKQGDHLDQMQKQIPLLHSVERNTVR
jgi:hypothetical protein